MAHIVNCMFEGNADDFTLSLGSYISKGVSPQSSNDSLKENSFPVGPEKPHLWRMQQPERKYQLFPKDKTASAPSKSLDPEQAFALAMGQNQNGEKGEKAPGGPGLRIRIKEHNLIRRRKASVPELGPMTTVHEVAMDSPTIPGRPAMHERSISAPTWKTHRLAECMTSSASGFSILDEKPELESGSQTAAVQQPLVADARQPLSPKSLTPLVIPQVTTHHLLRQMSFSRLRSGSTPVDPTINSARTEQSPMAKTPFTPLSASTTLTTPMSAPLSSMPASTLVTPVSAPLESRSSPKPWDRPSNASALGISIDTIPEASSAPQTGTESRPTQPLGHRRNQSESGTISGSIMERGRPRKRSDKPGAAPVKRSGSKRSKSAERRAFEQLPKGWKAGDAVKMMDKSEAVVVQKQALQQAARFEVLRKEDVDNLSRELRHLDERTEYLRRTYTSLRAGRRNLHSRICQYLRSPRTAKFNEMSMLKQEEALAELDASIDDWVTKLEHAENRRTRVRQKLLEHVAAATTLPVSPIVGVTESLHFAMGIRPNNASDLIATPPRSPTKATYTHTLSSSPSPQRVVAQVPSTILEQPLFEEAATIGLAITAKDEPAAASIRRAETIRIYADNDVYALLADVENQITKMSGDIAASASKEAAVSDNERRAVHRAHSHEALHGPRSDSSPPSKQAAQAPQEIFLTNAVFRPQEKRTTEA